VGLDALEDAPQPGAVGEVAVVQEEACSRLVRVAVDVLEPVGVEGARAPDDPVDLVALSEEQIGEIRAVLTRDAGAQGALHRPVLAEKVAPAAAPGGRPPRTTYGIGAERSAAFAHPSLQGTGCPDSSSASTPLTPTPRRPSSASTA